MPSTTRRSSGGDRLTGDLARAAASWLAFVLALGLAGVASAAARSAGASGDVARAVPAAVVLAVAVPLVLVAHGRARWASVLALKQPRRAALGVLVALGSVGAVLLGDHLLGGGVAVTDVDAWRLVRWLVVTLLVAAALEAVPEELAFRGGVFGGLSAHLPGWFAGVLTTAAFVVAPAASIWTTAALGRWLGVGVPGVTFAPDGQDPVSYAALLAGFGVVLLLVRAVTGSVWACVGFHLAFLVVNRLLLGDVGTTGLALRTGEGAEVLVVAYLAVAALVLAVVRWRRR